MECQKCDLCNSKYNDLDCLSCEHKTCKNCFYKICLFNKEMIEAYYYEENKELDLKCLQCSLGTLKITKQQLSQKLYEDTEKTEKEEENVCPLHNKELNIYCSGCRIQMCSDCFISHKALPMFFTHEQDKSPNSPPTIFCGIHQNRLLRYYCIDCNCALCDLCKSSHRSEHKLRLIKEFYNEIKLEFTDQFVIPRYTEEEISKRLDNTDKELKEKMHFEVANIKDKIHTTIDYLNETLVQIDKELKIICGEIDTNNSISKVLLKNLMRDLDNIFKSTEYDINCQYLIKIPKYNSLFKKEIKNDIISETIDEIKSSIEKYNKNIHNKSNFEIVKKCIEKKLSTSSFVNMYKSNYQINEKYNAMSLSNTITGHTDWVSSLVELQDGRIASSSFDNTIRVWEPQENYKCTQIITEHNGSVFSLIQLKDGRLASSSADKTIKIWKTGEKLECIQTLLGHAYSVYKLIQLKDGRIASGSADKTIKIWNTNDNFKCTHTLDGQHDTNVYSLMQLRDGRLATGAGDKTIKIWKTLDKFECTHTLLGHTSVVHSIIQLKDNRIASASGDNSIRIWNTKENFRCTHTLTGHTYIVSSLITLQDGRIASSLFDKTIRIYNPHDNFKCSDILSGHSYWISTLMQLQDGKIASGSYDYTIRIWS